jgi:hypothetical protein
MNGLACGMHFSGMAQILTSAKGTSVEAISGRMASQSFVKTTAFLNRPILTGLLSLLVVLGYCQTYGTSVNPAYPLSRYPAVTSVSPSSSGNETDPNGESSTTAVPLLFLSFIGLAGLALSRTGASRETEAKDLSAGQKDQY